ncbi:hypothetical protein N9D61_08895 [Planktomarina sp.]|jgi:hypothetical protein|nr:hypothetical protein [Planktomarina sp.]
MRKLLDGTEVYDEDKADNLLVYTKCPTKYKLVDMETGDEYMGLPFGSRHPNGLYDVYWEKIGKNNA